MDKGDDWPAKEDEAKQDDKPGKYLKGYEWADLLTLTERPDPIEEPIASAVWTATEEVANIANETVRRAAVETRLQATEGVRPAGDPGPEKRHQVR